MSAGRTTFLYRMLVAVALTVAIALQPPAAHADLSKTIPFSIGPQLLADALAKYSAQSGVQVTSPAELLEGKSCEGVVGSYSAQDALRRLLEGTNLAYDVIGSSTVAIRSAASVSSGAVSSTATQVADQQLRLAKAAGRTDTSQDTAGSGDSKPDSSAQAGVQEVIVTATKRAENIQNVPMSIAVIGNQDIERRGLIGMEDYLRSIPGVNQIDNGAQSNAIVIRGIATSPEFENATNAATVATYFDETPITGAAGYGQSGIDVRPVDIERIEVLKGPQGTSYGSASLGGTMRIIPVKPKLDTFSGKVAAAYSDTSGAGSDNSMIQGVVNIPVVENKFAVRAVGYRYEDSGFYRNVAGNDPATIALSDAAGFNVRGFSQDDVGHMVSTGGRLAALWQPTGRFDLSLNFLTQKIEQDGTPLQELGKYEQATVPIDPLAQVRDEPGEVNDTKINLTNLALNYDFGWAGLTSAVSWVDSGSIYAYDYSGPFLGPVSGRGPSDFESLSTEVRLASHLAGRFQFLAGLYYENVDDDYTLSVYRRGTNPFGFNPILISGTARELDQRAIFGEISYDLTEKLTATVGARYFKYDKTQRTLLEGSLYGVQPGAGVPTTQRGDDDGSTLKAILSYKPTDNTLLYASWGQGFRLGPPDGPGLTLNAGACDTNNDGIVDGTNLSIASTQHVDSDFLDNYEVGAKLAFFDRRVVVDASVYHITWDGLPVRTAIACGAQQFGYTANAGEATSDGAELQASVFVTQGLRVDFGAGYTRAELSKDAPGQGWRKGDRLPGSPKTSVNLAAQYDFDVAGHAAFVRADSFYTGKFYGDFLETPVLRAGDYIKVDARAGVRIKSLSVELFIRNLTDEDAYTWRGLSDRGPFFGYLLRPRTVGLQLGYDF